MLNDLQYYFGLINLNLFNIILVDIFISFVFWVILLIKGKKDELITNTEWSLFKLAVIFLIVFILSLLSISFCFDLNLKETDYKQIRTVEYQIDKDDVKTIKKLNQSSIRIVVKDLKNNTLKEKTLYTSKNIKDFTKANEKIFKIKVEEYKVNKNNFTKVREFLIPHPQEFNLITEIN